MAGDQYQDDYRSELEEGLEGDVGAPQVQPHAIEQVLLQPTPRAVQVRTKSNVARWVLIGLLVGLPAIFLYFGKKNQANWEGVRDHGVEATATLTHKTPRKHGKRSHGPSGTYTYTVGGVPYTVNSSFTDAEYTAATVGRDTKKVKYLPEDPGTGYLVERLNRGGETNNSAIVCWVLAGISALIVGGIWLYVERIRRRRIALAEEGVAVVTSRLDVTIASGKKDEKNYKLDYSFVCDGRQVDSGSTLHGDLIKDLLYTNGGATVLYDPADPARNELYVSVLQTVTVLPSATSFAP